MHFCFFGLFEFLYVLFHAGGKCFVGQRVRRNSSASLETESSSARASGDNPASRRASPARVPSRARRLFRKFFLFCAKHSFTKSRNACSSATSRDSQHKLRPGEPL